MRLENKCVPIHANPEVRERCHVYLLDLYISKLPPEARERDFFYARPLYDIPKDPSKPWYCAAPIGRITLASCFKNMYQNAGIHGKKTNHCLRATGASELFDAGVPEKIIKERTGHRSVEALRIYEHTTKKQHMAVSKILTNCQKTTFESALKKEELTYNTSPFHPASNSTVNKFSNCTVHIYQAPMGQAQKPN